MKTLTNVLEPDPLTSDIAPPVDTTSSDTDDDDEELLERHSGHIQAEHLANYPENWHEILREDVVAKTRTLVNVCRKSPQRRQTLQMTITAGKERGEWEIKGLQLLRDVDTRWSSLYLMIDRYIYLEPVSIHMC